jgi:CPA1 family monovalent cation:H+ antiporter
MFGQLALLSRQTPRAQVTAISHTTLLVLDESRFRRLLKRSQNLRAAVLKSAEKRGLDVASLQL